MKKFTQLVKASISFSLFTVAMSISSQASASLIVRDGGMVYDDVLDITWLQDANYAMTTGRPNAGKISWSDAKSWASGLVYGGYDDWRLPNISPEDTNCAIGTDPVIYSGYNCTKNELGHLFYEDFGFEVGATTPISTEEGLRNMNLFTNIGSGRYWFGSGIPHPTRNSTNAFVFNTRAGNLSNSPTDRTSYVNYAWFVRDGDVANTGEVSEVPEPGSLALLSLAVFGLGVRRFSS
ncbi:PEP-CTERM sorting domain-containing protein [Thalassomonas haliotis]|uniref:DUF1566 domain-containing protein n=1 Tax=Thalassomonas haliotis TaxID=485448 RepID=A0ABY7VKZ4_9GAMM|nr:PEP-CTERM sorting domain-containing protein [Thalassomonas haliotis]WDE14447.1 DUF1566 domain-containing protein [Thalassomonas haliotis]